MEKAITHISKKILTIIMKFNSKNKGSIKIDINIINSSIVDNLDIIYDL